MSAALIVLVAAGVATAPAVVASASAQGAPDVLPPEALPPSVDDLDTPTTELEAPSGPAPAITEEQEGTSELDTLFADLAGVTSEDQAKPIVSRIQRIWSTSGSATVDLLMSRAGSAMKAKNLPLALDLLDVVVRLAPDYAEGWNRRATVNYLREDFGRAMVDIERVLAIEPRHWGAMSGLGIILRRIGRDDEALETFRQVLKIHPISENARKAVDDLAAKAAGSPI
ncbi:tetratricopeptide repeat protein [Stappia sp. MMSF_3263]|uniref:tetratricopeptide repeat protein n=1 Tax=Stappia sp. MMSF_3263 TaxID=3046693 RepID=UPI00273DFCB6|nr:tetratricopeptide repeat protein [Stappia sp. MMSF_3263]